MVNRMESWNECPKCGFEGLMIFKGPFKATNKKYICPECDHKLETIKLIKTFFLYFSNLWYIFLTKYY